MSYSELASTSLPPTPVPGQKELLSNGNMYRNPAEDLLLYIHPLGRAAPKQINSLVSALQKVSSSLGAYGTCGLVFREIPRQGVRHPGGCSLRFPATAEAVEGQT